MSPLSRIVKYRIKEKEVQFERNIISYLGVKFEIIVTNNFNSIFNVYVYVYIY